MSFDPTSGAAAVESAVVEHPFLAGLTPEHLRVLSDNSMRVHYKPGDVIFREGDPANRFYLIEHGRVSLESHRKNEPPVTVQIIGPGDVLGWSWLFRPYHWNFDARAIEMVTALFFYATRLREQCEQDHALGYELMKRMATVAVQRLQSARKQLLALHR